MTADDSDVLYTSITSHLSATLAVSIFASTAMVISMPPWSFGPVGTQPISGSVLWGNVATMLIGEVKTLNLRLKSLALQLNAAVFVLFARV